MPVFHTKTIQSILDPVAQQVSQLVILHEDAAEGRIVPDLSVPVTAVGAAVQNLVVVGKQTLEHSKDEILRKDMPPTFETVEGSSQMLVDASVGLKENPESKEHRKLLLGGARGILQGVSSLLLVFDQAEVRKIVKACEGIVEYIKVSEVVQTMEELVTFTKNLSPGMTTMTKMVDARQQDLTNATHADILAAESDQTKRALPLLLSSMKAFVSLRREKKKGSAEAQENRNYIVSAMTESIQELIRVLQLTSPTDEQGAFATSTGAESLGAAGGALPGSFAAKINKAKDLISQTGTNPAVNKAGLEAVQEVLKEARKLARGLAPDKKAAIEQICDEIDSLMRELAELQARGEGDSPRAREIAALLGERMDYLEKELKKAVARKVAENFKDPLGPLNALTEAALAPIDTANREETYGKRAVDFQQHSKKMADTAAALAKTGGITDRKLADDLIATAGKVGDFPRWARVCKEGRPVKALAPQVQHAARIVFDNPNNEAAKEHYTLVKEDYQRQVQKLTKLVDSGVDAADFIAVSEEQLRADLEAAKALTKSGTNPQQAFQHIASAARTANRVVAITQGEVENTEDPEFKSNLGTAGDQVTQAIAPMVTSARSAITQTGNAAAHEEFSKKADNLVSAVHDVHDVVDKHYNPPPPPPRPPSPTPELEPALPPRPPSPVEAVEEIPVQSENPIGFAAHQLDKDAKQWEDNPMVAAARTMAKYMMQMAKFTRGEGGEVHSKRELIETARLIVKESEAVVKMARKVAEACTDRRMKRGLLQLVEKIPTIATQLKIIAAVKATRQGGDDPEADQEASEMLTNNAQNLMGAVSEVLYSTEAATIRVPPEARANLGLQWVKRGTRHA